MKPPKECRNPLGPRVGPILSRKQIRRKRQCAHRGSNEHGRQGVILRATVGDVERNGTARVGRTADLIRNRVRFNECPGLDVGNRMLPTDVLPLNVDSPAIPRLGDKERQSHCAPPTGTAGLLALSFSPLATWTSVKCIGPLVLRSSGSANATQGGTPLSLGGEGQTNKKHAASACAEPSGAAENFSGWDQKLARFRADRKGAEG